MTNLAQLRKAALALPEVEEGTHFGMVAFRMRGKGFASVTKDGQVQLHLPDDEVAAALKVHPEGERLVRAGTVIGFRVALADIDGQALNYMVRRAWSARAPRRLAAELAAADEAVPGESGDLPASIGRPATQALHGAGLTTLEQVSSRSEADLLALHGVGPKAVRIIVEALQERGTSLQ